MLSFSIIASLLQCCLIITNKSLCNAQNISSIASGLMPTLVGYWPLTRDFAARGAIALDGTVYGSPNTVPGPTGLPHKAFSMSYSDDGSYVEFQHANLHFGANNYSWTIAFWAYTEDAGEAALMSYSDANFVDALTWQCSLNGLMIFGFVDQGGNERSASFLSSTGWQFVALTYNVATLTLSVFCNDSYIVSDQIDTSINKPRTSNLLMFGRIGEINTIDTTSPVYSSSISSTDYESSSLSTSSDSTMPISTSSSESSTSSSSDFPTISSSESSPPPDVRTRFACASAFKAALTASELFQVKQLCLLIQAIDCSPNCAPDSCRFDFAAATTGYYICNSCLPGWTGTACENAINCSSTNCSPGECVFDVSVAVGYTCTSCMSGWTGFTCETPIGVNCTPSCQNGGSCTALSTCSCKSGWTGLDCSTVTCSPSCINGGICVTGQNGCNCTGGWTGNWCEIPNTVNASVIWSSLQTLSSTSGIGPTIYAYWPLTYDFMLREVSKNYVATRTYPLLDGIAIGGPTNLSTVTGPTGKPNTAIFTMSGPPSPVYFYFDDGPQLQSVLNDKTAPFTLAFYVKLGTAAVNMPIVQFARPSTGLMGTYLWQNNQTNKLELGYSAAQNGWQSDCLMSGVWQFLAVEFTNIPVKTMRVFCNDSFIYTYQTLASFPDKSELLFFGHSDNISIASNNDASFSCASYHKAALNVIQLLQLKQICAMQLGLQCWPQCLPGTCDYNFGASPNGNFACICNANYTGPKCNIPICIPACANGGTCSTPKNCTCTTSWQGANCTTPVCKPGCMNGGSCIAPNNCSCPSDYQGAICQTRINSGAIGFCRTPNYPNNYNNNQEHSWLISVAAGSYIQLELDIRGIEFEWDYFDIYDGSTSSALLLARFLQSDLRATFVTSSNVAFLRFKADANTVARGVEVLYRQVDKNPDYSYEGNTTLDKWEIYPGDIGTIYQPNETLRLVDNTPNKVGAMWAIKPFNFSDFVIKARVRIGNIGTGSEGLAVFFVQNTSIARPPTTTPNFEFGIDWSNFKGLSVFASPRQSSAFASYWGNSTSSSDLTRPICSNMSISTSPCGYFTPLRNATFNLTIAVSGPSSLRITMCSTGWYNLSTPWCHYTLPDKPTCLYPANFVANVISPPLTSLDSAVLFGLTAYNSAGNYDYVDIMEVNVYTPSPSPSCSGGCTTSCTPNMTCICPNLYKGASCDQPLCTSPCSNGGTCIAPNTCACTDGWQGMTCSAAICNPSCKNGGSCASPNVCSCATGWTNSTNACTIPVCSPVCQNGGTCTAPNACSCTPQYTDTQCQKPVCTLSCLNGGNCTAPDVCTCPATYTGPRCQTPLCSPPCLNGGTCTAPNNCTCGATGWIGPTCSIPVCSLICQNNGTCVAPNTCNCTVSFTGPTCNISRCFASCNGGTLLADDTCMIPIDYGYTRTCIAHNLTGAIGFCRTPNFPSDYVNVREDTWLITVAVGSYIQLEVDIRAVEDSWDYFDIYDGASTSALLLARLLRSGVRATFVTSSNVAFLRFKSDYGTVAQGLEVLYRQVDKNPDYTYEGNTTLTNWQIYPGNSTTLSQANGTLRLVDNVPNKVGAMWAISPFNFSDFAIKAMVQIGNVGTGNEGLAIFFVQNYSIVRPPNMTANFEFGVDWSNYKGLSVFASPRQSSAFASYWGNATASTDSTRRECSNSQTIKTMACGSATPLRNGIFNVTIAVSGPSSLRVAMCSTGFYSISTPTCEWDPLPDKPTCIYPAIYISNAISPPLTSLDSPVYFGLAAYNSASKYDFVDILEVNVYTPSNSPSCSGGCTTSCTPNMTCTCPNLYTGGSCDRPLCASPCLNGGTCISPNTCQCQSGWQGMTCAIPFCSPNCLNGGSCTGPFFCTCAAGWTGSSTLCTTPVCSPNCVNGGTCTAPNSCSCPTEYNGTTCSIPTCSPSCQNGGTCSSPNNCTCPASYTGPTCTIPVCVSPCQNGGTCVAPNTCNCTSSYSGSTCTVPVCSSPCQHGGTCSAPDTCDCPLTSWNGTTCTIPVCTPSCQNGGNCTAPGICNCTSSWQGTSCSTPVCIPACMHGGTCDSPNHCACSASYTGTTCSEPVCTPVCANGGTCTSPNTCNCTAQYSGPTCQTPVCSPMCQNGGTCASPNNCSCQTGWQDSTCTTAICTLACQNGGTCSAPDVCTCTGTWTGATCSTPVCSPNCSNGGTCSLPNVCDCPPLYNGTICNIPVCAPSCQNGATCSSPNNCTCTTQYSGPVCETPICNSPCQNGANCTAPDICTCATGWYGATCQTPICSPSCVNGGTCIAPDLCSCVTGSWEGSICNIPICSISCSNGGNCTLPGICTCATGWTGNTTGCIQPVCTLPCQNGGTCSAPDNCTCGGNWTGISCAIPTCTPVCENGATCTAPNVCSCATGWTGNTTSCTTAICSSACLNGATCSSPETCTCTTEWIGLTCEIPVCTPSCHNGGTCIQPNNCTCTSEWTGPSCETPICAPECLNGATCSSPNNCTCTAAWSGPICEIPICSPGCVNGGTCINPDICSCVGHWMGPVCNMSCLVDSDCSNGGTCYNGVCYCDPGWTDQICQMPFCDPPCDNGGSCTGPFACTCTFGWGGSSCSNSTPTGPPPSLTACEVECNDCMSLVDSFSTDLQTRESLCISVPVEDFADECAHWAAKGNCLANAAFMWSTCRASCSRYSSCECDVPVGKPYDLNCTCGDYAAIGLCEKDPDIRTNCSFSCGRRLDPHNICTPKPVNVDLPQNAHWEMTPGPLKCLNGNAGYLQTAMMVCDIGFHAEKPGDTGLHVCEPYTVNGEKGNWVEVNPKRPSCVRADCPKPPEIEGGFYINRTNSSVYRAGDMLTFSCMDGLKMSGAVVPVANCSFVGPTGWTWHDGTPDCNLPPCNALIEGVNTVVQVSANHTGGIASYKCQAGYRPTVDQVNFVKTCQPDGTWAPEEGRPECAVVRCDQPPEEDNAYLTGAKPCCYEFGDQVTVRCMKGSLSLYTQPGTESSPLEYVVNTCLDTGFWSTNTLNCLQISCSTPDHFEIGQYRVLNGSEELTNLLYSDVILFECDYNQGYEPDGNQTVSRAHWRCTENGTWDKEPLSCVKSALIRAPVVKVQAFESTAAVATASSVLAVLGFLLGMIVCLDYMTIDRDFHRLKHNWRQFARWIRDLRRLKELKQVRAKVRCQVRRENDLQQLEAGRDAARMQAARLGDGTNFVNEAVLDHHATLPHFHVEGPMEVPESEQYIEL